MCSASGRSAALSTTGLPSGPATSGEKTPSPGIGPVAKGAMFAGASAAARCPRAMPGSAPFFAPSSASCCAVSLPPVGGALYVSFSSQVTAIPRWWSRAHSATRAANGSVPGAVR